MTLQQANELCAQVNNIEDSGYRAEVEKITNHHLPGFPAAIVVKHIETGNEIAHAAYLSEAQYIVRQITDRFKKD